MLVVPRQSQTGYNGHGLGRCPFLWRAEIDIQLDLSIVAIRPVVMARMSQQGLGLRFMVELGNRDNNCVFL